MVIHPLSFADDARLVFELLDSFLCVFAIIIINIVYYNQE
jgi:hypothetical protein